MTGLDVTPPRPNELEVSVFGPGRGEAVVVHLGGGQWITVDSCRDQRTGAHPALDYLSALGVDPANQVKLVVATHAHDDHTAGIADLYRVCTSAKFVTSTAFTSSEFFASTAADASIESRLVPSVRSEYREVIAEVKRRPRASQPHLLQAAESKLLLETEAWSTGPRARVFSLSPSDQAITRSKLLMARGLAVEGERPKLAAADPNEYTVALWIELGEQAAILLGGDLLNGPTACGWKRVVQSHSPVQRASLYKVAHHGSVGSHHQPAWDKFLTDGVVSVLTPFRLGPTTSIPKATDVSRLVERSGRAFITAKPVQPTPSRDLKRVRSMLGTVAIDVRERDGQPGQIQARLASDDTDWRVSLVQPAYQLT